ncbi:hypothetical protein IP91_04124 [Pseudoduganella lurida]|uniref:Uncharacterized protein n=1 Tax=Pseudoduganella lurida TaxID=1036180 RepID=A0A562R193_9BURK|nr:hypothetical protein [Pseudoduganella lurida]TWI62603.1 hypothetical protein IP91_04124 [Pseudoduganella lurida]
MHAERDTPRAIGPLRRLVCVAGVVVLAAHCLAAQGQPSGAPATPRTDLPAPSTGVTVPPEPAALPAASSPQRQAAPAIADERLAELRGGTDTPWSDMKLNGTVGGNAATNVVTGANIITDGAFSNASGLPMVIQNSGANVLIQNATIVNVQFK